MSQSCISTNYLNIELWSEEETTWLSVSANYDNQVSKFFLDCYQSRICSLLQILYELDKTPHFEDTWVIVTASSKLESVNRHDKIFSSADLVVRALRELERQFNDNVGIDNK